MSTPKSEPVIDLQAMSQQEQGRRTAPQADDDATSVEHPFDTVRIIGTPRAQTGEREMLKQPLPRDPRQV